MKRFSKFASIFLAMILVLSAVFALAACESAESKALKTLILPENETIVKENFTLPKTLHSGEDSYPLTWESGNTAALKVTDPGAESETYTAEVYPQDETTPVTLTAKAGGATRDFRVLVTGVNALTFADNYKFSMTNKSTTTDFNLDTSWTYLGKNVTIAWTVVGDSADFVEIQNGNKCHIVSLPDDDDVQITLKATFTYGTDGTDTASKNYSFVVSPEFTHEQEVLRRFSVVGSPLEIEGYILHINEVSASYGNATFWMIDEDFCSGYYLYRVSIDKASADKYVVGAHVKVSGDTAKNYNGLWENNSGGKVELVDDTVLTADQLASHTKDLDAELVAGVDSGLWRQSTMVKLNGWKVKSLPSKPTGADQNLVTLTHSGVDIVVRISKYVFPDSKDTELANVLALYDTLKAAKDKGDVYVNVTGLLGYYDGAQIQPVKASDVTIVTAEGTDNGSKLKTAAEAVSNAVKTNFEGKTIVGTKTVTMPISSEGVTISYELVGKTVANNPTVVIDNQTGAFTITPTATRRNYDVKVTYTIGEAKYADYFKLANQLLDDEGIVKAVRVALSLEKVDFEEETSLTLPANADALGYEGVTITWTVKDADKTTWLTVANGKLNVTIPAAASTGTVVATITKGTARTTRNFVLTAKRVFEKLTAPKAGQFVLSALHKGERLYVSSTDLDGKDKVTGYLQTSNDPTKAVKLTLEETTGGWLIKLGDKYLEVNPYKNSSNKTSYNLKLVDQPTDGVVWEWQETEQVFAQKSTQHDGTEISGGDNEAYFYVGLRDNSDYTTISPSAIKYIRGNNAANLDVTQHPARLGNYVG